MEKIKFAFYVIRHPFDGFWSMKYAKKGSLWFSILLIVLLIAANVFSRQVSAFLFNQQIYVPLNIWTEIRNVVLIFTLIVIGNWSITTLMDGKGNLKDIIMVCGYACTPVIISKVAIAIFTNVASYSESGIINFINIAFWIWFFVLLFFGTMTIHEYSFGKNVFTVILTIISMAIVVFVCIVFVNLVWQMVGFIAAAYQELQLRF